MKHKPGPQTWQDHLIRAVGSGIRGQFSITTELPVYDAVYKRVAHALCGWVDDAILHAVDDLADIAIDSPCDTTLKDVVRHANSPEAS